MLQETKAQSVLEYILTYGWAIMAIITVIGVLIFVSGEGASTTTCTTFLNLICKGIGLDGDTLVIVLQNSAGQTITIDPLTEICFDGICGYAEIVYNGTVYKFDKVSIKQGEEFAIVATTTATEISITYLENQSGLKKIETSNIKPSLKKAVITECATTINEAGVYVLEGNIIQNNENLSCISIESSNVTINCQNNSITGIGKYFGIYQAIQDNPLENIAIINCDISNFGRGINLGHLENSLISNNTVHDNTADGDFTATGGEDLGWDGRGIEILYGNNNTIKDNKIEDNHNGIAAKISENITVNNNEVLDSTDDGIALKECENCKVINNQVLSTGLQGNEGIVVSKDSTNVVLNNNNVKHDKGIKIEDSEVELNNNKVNIGNIACGFDKGIWCRGSFTVTGSGNSTNKLESCSTEIATIISCS